MKDLLDKLSSYNLFNYLLPGTIFVAGAERVTAYRFRSDSIVIDLFAYYFIGLVISRLGSLVVAPILQKIDFIKFAPYTDFIAACDKDAKIDVLSEQNNMFRTLAALFLALPLFKSLDVLATRLGLPPEIGLILLFGALFFLFVFAYRKQTDFVRRRVEARTK